MKDRALHKFFLIILVLLSCRFSSMPFDQSELFKFGSDFEKIWLATEKYNYNHEIARLSLYLKDQPVNEKYEEQIIQSLPENLKLKAKIWMKPIIGMAVKYNLDPLWVISVIWTESNFAFNALSPSGALGLMQILPATGRGLVAQFRNGNGVFESEKGIHRIQELMPFILVTKNQRFFIKKLNHIELGVYYLKQLLDQFNHNLLYATVAYNMGPAWTKKQIRIHNAQSNHRYWLKVNKAYAYLSTQVQ